MDIASEAGLALADRHRTEVDPTPEGSVVNYGESIRAGGWSLRSALVRVAQPEPARVGVVLELLRRCDGALQPLARALERHTVSNDRNLSIDALASSREVPAPATRADGAPVEGNRYPDSRTVDLARLARSDPASFPALLASYSTTIELDDEERAALPLLEVALGLDHLGEVLATWAEKATIDPPPIQVIDEICAEAFERLDTLGVPREQPPTGPGRRPR